MKGFLSVPEAAKAIGWHPDTVRKYLVPHKEWKANGKQGVPYFSFAKGQRPKVPQWWVDSVLEAGTAPPDDES